jgi:phosphoribosyl-ATP pyrophosphohydrolase
MAKTIKAKPTKLKATKAKNARMAVQAAAKPLKAKTIQRAVSSVSSDGHSALVLDRLYKVVLSRRTADPALSHSARLLGRGRAKVAQKFGEEAVEALIEGVGGNQSALVAESADVLYHLLLMWVACDVTPGEIWAELARREGVSGLLEKASRPLPRDLATRKIP